MTILKFLLNLCQDKQILWDPSDPSYKHKIKSVMRFCKQPKHCSVAGWNRLVHIKN